MVSRSVGAQELRSFHDYAFTRFEERLTSDEKVTSVDESNIADRVSELASAQFVAVSGKALLTDVEQLTQLMKEFNTIGEALAYVGNYDDIQKLKSECEEELRSVKDRNRKAALRQQIKSVTNIKRLAAETGLQQDQQFLDKLTYLMGYMMGRDLEISIAFPGPGPEGYQFSAPLTREFLRDDCYSLVRKYSRRTEDPLTIFGIVTQGRGVPAHATEEEEQEGDEGEFESFRPALRKLVHATADVEHSFFGRVTDEFVIDPIAVFRSL